MRTIKEIYNDVLAWRNKYGDGAFGESNYINHSGDSQEIDSAFLENMYSTLLVIIDQTRYDTHDDFYSAKNVYLVDSGWWSTTTAQREEVNVLRYGDYRRSTTGGAPLLEGPFSQNNVDENGALYQASTVSLFQTLDGDYVANAERTIKIPKFYFDRPDITKYQSTIDGLFFDPSIVQIETLQGVIDWFSAYDDILQDLLLTSNVVIHYDDYKPPIESPVGDIYTLPNLSSDRYLVKSSFQISFWEDDETSESGEFVAQTITYSRLSSTSDTKTFTIYSEAITISIDDDEGGYFPFTFPVSEDGIDFNDSLEVIYNKVLVLLPNTNTHSGTPEYQHHPTVTTIDLIDYDGGEYERTETGDFVITCSEITDRYEKLLQSDIDSNYDVEFFYTKTMGANNVWEEETAVIETSTKEPLKVIENISFNGDVEFSYSAEMPVFPAEGDWFFVNNLRYYKLVDFPVDSGYTLYALQPPI